MQPMNLVRAGFAVIALTLCTAARAQVDNITQGTSHVTIQSAIVDALNGDEIVISSGTYTEDINFLGKAIHVRSVDPSDWSVVESTIVEGQAVGTSVVTFESGESNDSILDGLTITSAVGGNGGGITVIDSAPKITHCDIRNNFGVFGGGIGMVGSLNDVPTIIINNRIRSNEAAKADVGHMAAYGGGISCSGPAEIRNNLIAYNVVRSDFNGHAWGGGISGVDDDVFVIGNTIVGNQSILRAAISGSSSAPGNVRNCIIWGNRNPETFEGATPAERSVSSAIGLSHSIVDDYVVNGPHVIHELPRFVDAPNGDYRLLPWSPGVDTGDDGAIEPGETDLLGSNRVMGVHVDMGAYEVEFADTNATLWISAFPRDAVTVTVLPADLDANGNGNTTLARNYAVNTLVAITAPATDGISEFSHWELDGENAGTSLSLDLVMNRHHVARAVFQTTRTVCATGADHTTIQGAIDASSAGDEVVICPGTYGENINFLGKDISVRGEDPNDLSTVLSTIITATTTASTVSFTNGETIDAELAGLTIEGGVGTADDVAGDAVTSGGGIYCTASSPTIRDNIITGNGLNNPAGYGGGLAVYADARPKVLRNTITGNVAGFGAGLLVFEAAPLLESNIFAGNETSTGFAAGGGLATWRSQPAIVNSLIAGNICPGTAGGGGIYVEVGIVNFLLTNTTIAFNQSVAGTSGGLDTAEFNGLPVSQNSIIWGNIPDQLSDIDRHEFSCVQGFVPNQADTSIGDDPHFLDGSSGTWSTAGVFAGTTLTTELTDGTASWIPGALIGRLLNPNTNQWRQFVIVANTVSTITVIGDASTIAGSGNSYQVHDYRLSGPLGDDSPCIDSANNAVFPWDLSTDLARGFRFADSPLSPDCPQAGVSCGTSPVIDMGAHEFFVDCNENGIADDHEQDLDSNGIPDECEYDGTVTVNLSLNGAGIASSPYERMTTFRFASTNLLTEQVTTQEVQYDVTGNATVVFEFIDSSHSTTSVDGCNSLRAIAALDFVGVESEATVNFDGANGLIQGDLSGASGTPDNVLDSHDWNEMNAQFAGPGGPSIPLGSCGSADLWVDGNVDLLDFFTLQQSFGAQLQFAGFAPNEHQVASMTRFSEADCNSNGVLDWIDINSSGVSKDCDLNGIPDECDIAEGTNDCNTNGMPDDCDTVTDFSDHVITTAADGANSVFAADLDGDGDADALSASVSDSKIVWYENTDGLGTFSPGQIITNAAGGAQSVFAMDLDGDGDADVLSASYTDDKIAWYENTDGLGTFGPQEVITTDADSAAFVYAADLDGDGDADVLSASSLDDKIVWYENTDGLGSFGPQQVITTDADAARSVFAADLDGDGDADVLSASYDDDKIAWYENTDGLGSFGPQLPINSDANGAFSVFAADLDGDGDADVLASSTNSGSIGWYENTDGLGSFGTEQNITSTISGSFSVFAADMDGDGDADALSASIFDNLIAWYENTNGLGDFGAGQVITDTADGAVSVFATDLDGDGDTDVLSASTFDDTIAWYENNGDDCNGNKIPDECDIADATSNDCNANGVPDECETQPDSGLEFVAIQSIAMHSGFLPELGIDIDPTDFVVNVEPRITDVSGLGIVSLRVRFNVAMNVGPSGVDVTPVACSGLGGATATAMIDLRDSTVVVITLSHAPTNASCTVFDLSGLVAANGCVFGSGTEDTDFSICFLEGDVNGDGSTNFGDSGTIANPSNLNLPVDQAAAGASADLDRSGFVDASDYYLSREYENLFQNVPTGGDCNGNGQPDECEADCNDNQIADACDISLGTSIDCDSNGVPDECQPDCNNNQIADACDIELGTSIDCNRNRIPDACELSQFDGLALCFDGAGDHVLIPSDSALRPVSGFTVEAWVKPRAIGVAMAIVRHDDDGGNDDGYLLRINAAGQAVFAAKNFNTVADQNVTSSQTLPAGIWTHIAGVYDPPSIIVYVDGVPTAESNASDDVRYDVTAQASLNIGRRGGVVSPNSNFFDGVIDEVRIWSTARSQAQIQANMGLGLNGSEAGLIGLWKFDEGFGVSIIPIGGYPIAEDSAGSQDGMLEFDVFRVPTSKDINMNGIPDECDVP